LRAGIRILADVIGYRLRRLEMANLAGALTIMTALHLAWPDALVRAGFAALLNVLVYLNNDYRDVAIDARSPDRDPVTVAFLRTHMREALALQWSLAGLLTALALSHSPDLIVAGALGGGVCWAYSKHLKHRPYVDVVAMTVWGFAMPLCAVPLDRPLGIWLAVQLGLFSSVFECIQVVRDRDVDAGLGLRTTAVALGVPRTVALGRLLTLLAAAYAALMLHPWSGAITALAALVPWRAAYPTRYWTQVKVVFGVAWLFACGAVYLHGESAGLWLRLAADATRFLPEPAP
jgi:4-hydroxybenzoate polyprenyltransferase